MRLFLFSILLCGVLSSVFSQTYRIIDPARDYYYGDMNRISYGDMNRVIHIDSVAVENGDWLYFNYELVNLCYTPYDFPKWLSHPVRLDSAGVYAFSNDSSETITLHSQSQPGMAWTIYTFPNGNALEANHTATLFAPFLGITDSVKEIVLMLKDTLGNPLPSEWNGKSFRLSQNHGLISTYNFDRFPLDTTSYLLVGVSHPEIGQAGMTARDIFDFEVGDEVQISEISYFWIDASGDSKRYTDRIITKEVVSDTVRYEIDRWTFHISFGFFGKDTTLSHEVIVQQFLLSENEQLPFESGDSSYLFAQYFIFRVQNGKLLKKYYPVHYDDSCGGWQQDYNNHPFYCIEGLGCGYYDRSDPYHTDIREPTYFNQNGVTWGNRFRIEDFITSRDPLQESLSLRLYPNPVSDVLHLKRGQGTAGKAARLELYDAFGRLHLQSEVPATGEQEIDVQMLKPGVYFYRLSADDGTFVSGKLVKR